MARKRAGDARQKKLKPNNSFVIGADGDDDDDYDDGGGGGGGGGGGVFLSITRHSCHSDNQS